MIGDVKKGLGDRISAGAVPHLSVTNPKNHRTGEPADGRKLHS
jgi:hypothetical protein